MMIDEKISRLRELATKAVTGDFVANCELVGEADPAAVLGLLDEREALLERVRDLKILNGRSEKTILMGVRLRTEAEQERDRLAAAIERVRVVCEQWRGAPCNRGYAGDIEYALEEPGPIKRVALAFGARIPKFWKDGGE